MPNSKNKVFLLILPQSPFSNQAEEGENYNRLIANLRGLETISLTASSAEARLIFSPDDLKTIEKRIFKDIAAGTRAYLSLISDTALMPE